MKLHYYRETDSLYVELNDRPGADTVEVTDDVRLDLDADGRPVGFDIDHASRLLDLGSLETFGLPYPAGRPGEEEVVEGREPRV